MELDSLLDHTRTDAVSCKYCDRSDGCRAAHLTRNEWGKELPPCNACIFHNLLSHSLIPNSINLDVAIRIIHSSSIQYVCVTQSFFRYEGIRGPPLS